MISARLIAGLVWEIWHIILLSMPEDVVVTGVIANSPDYFPYEFSMPRPTSQLILSLINEGHESLIMLVRSCFYLYILYL